MLGMSRVLAIVFAAGLTGLAAVWAQDTKPLPQTYVSPDESLTLRYPKGWSVEADQPGFVLVATDADLFDLGNENVPPGEAAVAVIFSNAEDEYLRTYFVGDTPEAVLAHLIDVLFSSGMELNVEFTPPSATMFNGLPAARSDGLFLENRIFLIVTALGDEVYSLSIGILRQSDFARFEPKLLAIAESVRFQPPGV